MDFKSLSLFEAIGDNDSWEHEEHVIVKTGRRSIEIMFS